MSSHKGLRPSASEAFFEVLDSGLKLGLETAPTDAAPFRIVSTSDEKDLPRRMFRLITAIEALEESDKGEIDQILDGAKTILRMKLAMFMILGWLEANGIATGELKAMIMEAIDGPIKPNSTLDKLQSAHRELMKTMGAAAPRMAI